MLKLPALAQGYKRDWLRCKKCREVFYFDFLPRSLSNPITWLPCGHGLGENLYDATVTISEQEAIASLVNNAVQRENQQAMSAERMILC